MRNKANAHTPGNHSAQTGLPGKESKSAALPLRDVTAGANLPLAVASVNTRSLVLTKRRAKVMRSACQADHSALTTTSTAQHREARCELQVLVNKQLIVLG